MLLSVMIPVLNGFEVLRRLKADPELSVPVMPVTAKGQERDVVEGLNTGAADYLAKPFSLKELAARVDRLLQRAATVP
ncbi:MAG: response regulator [Gemmatimonadales bacterium]